MNRLKENNIKLTKFRADADIDKGCAVAVGSFDGVHLGHRAMLSATVSEAKRLGVPAVAFTFDTDDSPKINAKLLAQHGKKLRLLSELGTDAVFSAPFSRLKMLSASDFAQKILYEAMGAKCIVCGYDFRFGNGRNGDVELIKRLLLSKNVDVVTPSAVQSNGMPISSTAIRTFISEGDIVRANEFLGRAFSFVAEVVHGAKLGRKLGFPTINQKYPESLVVPRFGVYAVCCTVGGKRFGGVANIGVKPTVGGELSPVCETFLFGYSGDCYGENVEIELVQFIRDETKFSSLEELVKQIGRDRETAKKILSEGVI